MNESIDDVSTYAWYNGRERGVALVCRKQRFSDPALVITFGECRSSDSIFVDSWMMEPNMNGPTVVDFPETAYQNRQTFPFGDIRSPYLAIKALMTRHFDRTGESDV